MWDTPGSRHSIESVEVKCIKLTGRIYQTE